jgi:hypothetical protein
VQRTCAGERGAVASATGAAVGGSQVASEQVRVRIVRDMPADGDSPALVAGSELLVDSTIAAALVLSGVAVEVSAD